MAELLRIRKVADTTTGERVVRFDQLTGERLLVDPSDGAVRAWPLAGVRVEGGPPAETSVGTSYVAEAIREGWIVGEGERVVHRPGGPDGNRWAKTHTFVHYDALTLRTLDGDVRYRVTHQPDKYADPGDDDTPVTDEAYAAGATRVDHFYGLALVTEG